MKMLFSDDELRSALDAARRSWDEAKGVQSQPGAQTQHGGQMQQGSTAQNIGLEFAQVKAVYHRLGCEAAQRWGLLR